jgi:hypothetical protein
MRTVPIPDHSALTQRAFDESPGPTERRACTEPGAHPSRPFRHLTNAHHVRI